MSMLAAQNAAAERLGGSTMWRDAMTPALPDFGAVPDADLVAAVRQPVAPAAPAQPSPADLERQEYMGLLKAGQIDENGMAKNGKMYRGPKAREFAALHGGWEPVLKDKDLAQQLNRITMNENRAFAGLDALPEPENTAATFGPVPEALLNRGITQDLWERANNIMRGNIKASPEEIKWATEIVTPQFSERASKKDVLAEKRKKAQEAQQKRIEVIKEGAENALRLLDRIEANAKNGIFPETGLSGKALSYIPGTDAYTLARDANTVKNMIAKGGLLDMKNTSANGASGFGQLTEKELDLLREGISRLDPLDDKNVFLDDLNFIRSRFEKAITPRDITDAELDTLDIVSPAAAPKRYKFTSDGALVGG